MIAIERTCASCGKKFIIRPYDESTGQPDYKFCYSCNRKWREKKRQKQEKIENERWAEQKEKERSEFEERLKNLNIVDVNDIHPASPLYIIGNGFDLMHGVKSSYRDFSKTLGKHSNIRFALETYLKDDDIWADFESALAHLDIEGMASDYIVDMWLDNFDAYNPDGQAADYFAAIDTATLPIVTISMELPKSFRLWVENLRIGTKDRPLQRLFVNGGRVLCFNYTEFVEDLYGMESVCYIHGCRRKIKGRPKEKLILGHMPGASDEEFDAFSQNYKSHIKNPGKRAMVEMAQDNVLRIISEYDESLTKNSSEIIDRHTDFFDSLSDREDVVVIGHSYSKVDWDYFSEVVKRVDGRWFFGCHGLRDLNNLEEIVASFGIANYSIFRTDVIKVKLDESEETQKNDRQERDTRRYAALGIKEKQFKKKCASKDGRWKVETFDGHFRILDRSKGNVEDSVMYETEFPSYIDRAFFTDDGRYLVILFRGANPGICVYKRNKSINRENEDVWTLTGELESMQYQSLINPRLRHVFVNGDTIMFVYNSQERKYSLNTAKLLNRNRRKYDSSRHYDGVEVSERFYGKSRGRTDKAI